MGDERQIFLDAIDEQLLRWKLELTGEQASQLWQHFQAVVETNRSFNLTRITDPAEAAVKHYADSLAIIHWASAPDSATRRVLDVGTGAGFPAVPLAIVRPDWQVTALDATAKKIRFLEQLRTALNLRNLVCVHEHAAHWQTPDRFDLVAYKAVGSLGLCAEQGARLLARQGRIAVFKTGNLSDAETAEARGKARELGLTWATFAYELGTAEETFQRELWFATRQAG